MISLSSFLPESRIAGVVRSTSASRFKPSGVNSKIQANTIAGTKPMARMTTTKRAGASPMPNSGKMVSATWISNHADTR